MTDDERKLLIAIGKLVSRASYLQWQREPGLVEHRDDIWDAILNIEKEMGISD